MHGVQDGLKFIGVFLMIVAVAQGKASVATTQIPWWVILLVGLVMFIGTCFGGYKVIKTVGVGMDNPQVLTYVKEHPEYVLSGDLGYLGLKGETVDVLSNLNEADTLANLCTEPLGARPVYLKDSYSASEIKIIVRKMNSADMSSVMKQPFEVHASAITILGDVDPDYPLQKKFHTMEYLRDIAYLRPRTNTFTALYRVRSVLAMAIHEFFQGKGFIYVHTPEITANDAEGAGQVFTVTTDAKDPINDFYGRRASLTVSGQLHAQ